jgi:hypothetical protein
MRVGRIRIGCLAALLLGPLAAGAAMYKCGNAYQDRPCGGDGPQQLLSPGGLPARSGQPASAIPQRGTAPVAPAADASRPVVSTEFCAARRKAAQEIAWKREAGATREGQRAEAQGRDSFYSDTIEAVYRRPRGSAVEVSKSIEDDCNRTVSRGGYYTGRPVAKASFEDCQRYRTGLQAVEHQRRSGEQSAEVLDRSEQELKGAMKDGGC